MFTIITLLILSSHIRTCLCQQLNKADCSSSSSTVEECCNLINSLQVVGTDAAFELSLQILSQALSQPRWVPSSNTTCLLLLYTKLELFYVLDWNMAEVMFNLSEKFVSEEGREEEVVEEEREKEAQEAEEEGSTPGAQGDLQQVVDERNLCLYGGWLYSTPELEDVEKAKNYFDTAKKVVDDFWSYFEYGAFSSHILEDYELARDNFEVAFTFDPQNGFLNFFYGLLLEYHLGEPEKGESMIQSALKQAPNLPGQATGNLVFQSILLRARSRYLEADRCCEFGVVIMPNGTNATKHFC